MKAMLLSAGLGRRMLPLTATLPKPAIPVLGRPMLEQILRRLARQGVRETVVNVHHLPDVVEALLAAEAGVDGLPRTHLSREERILGTAGGIRRAAPLLRGAGPILVHNADFLSDIDVREAVAAHRDSGKLATLVLAPSRAPYSRVDVDREGNVVSLGGEPRPAEGTVVASYLFTGFHVIEEELLERMPERPSGIVDVYRQLAAERRLGSIVHPGFWWEFGTPASYVDGCLELLRLAPERLAAVVATHDPVVAAAGGRVALGHGARIEEGARVDGVAGVARGAVVSAGALLRDSFVMDEARIGADCRLARVVVGPGAELPSGFDCEEAVAVRAAEGLDPAAVPTARRVGELLVQPFRPEVR